MKISINKLLNPSSNISTTRYILLQLLPYYKILLSIIIPYIIYILVIGKDVDWNGLGLYIGAITTSLASLIGVKAYQRKYENKQSENNNP